MDEMERLLKIDDVVEVDTILEDSPGGGNAAPTTSAAQIFTYNLSSSSSLPSTAREALTAAPTPSNGDPLPGTANSQRPNKLDSKTPRYLALCVNTGSMYKTLVEFDVSDKTSDAEVFYMLKEAYVNLRGLRAVYGILMKPVDIHFVHVSFTSRLFDPIPHLSA